MECDIRVTLSHLSYDHYQIIRSAFRRGRSIVVGSSKGLTSSDVLYRKSFTLTDNTLIPNAGRRIPPRYDGKPRFCVNYRALNKRMMADRFPVPTIEKALDNMAGSLVFTKLDMFAGYRHVCLEEHVQENTAFPCKYGTFQFLVMPFGLMYAPSIFQRMTTTVFHELNFVMVYIFDAAIGSKSMEEHVSHLRIVCSRICGSGLKLKLKKWGDLRRKFGMGIHEHPNTIREGGPD